MLNNVKPSSLFSGESGITVFLFRASVSRFFNFNAAISDSARGAPRSQSTFAAGPAVGRREEPSRAHRATRVPTPANIPRSEHESCYAFVFPREPR